MADFERTAEFRKVSDSPKIFRLKSRFFAENISFKNEKIDEHRAVDAGVLKNGHFLKMITNGNIAKCYIFLTDYRVIICVDK